MHFTQAQQALFVSIQAHRGALPHFDVLCAHLEAALDQILDTDKTPPFGVAAIVSANAEEGVKVLDSATVSTTAMQVGTVVGPISRSTLSSVTRRFTFMTAFVVSLASSYMM